MAISCVDKKTAVHLHNGMLHGSKKGEALTFCNSMDEPGKNYANELSQSVKEKYHMTSFICGI